MVSLFPDDYPPAEPERADDGPCCEHWASFVEAQGDGVHLTWTVMHRFAHDRLPFSAAALASLAGIDEDEATSAIDSALERGWIGPVRPEGYVRGEPTTVLYQGCLHRWR